MAAVCVCEGMSVLNSSSTFFRCLPGYTGATALISQPHDTHIVAACGSHMPDSLIWPSGIGKQAAIILCAVAVAHRFTACSLVRSPLIHCCSCRTDFKKRQRTEGSRTLAVCVVGVWGSCAFLYLSHTNTHGHTYAVSHSQINDFQLSSDPLMPNKAMGCLCWLVKQVWLSKSASHQLIGFWFTVENVYYKNCRQ